VLWDCFKSLPGSSFNDFVGLVISDSSSEVMGELVCFANSTSPALRYTNSSPKLSPG
jgi:hypothetical protein